MWEKLNLKHRRAKKSGAIFMSPALPKGAPYVPHTPSRQPDFLLNDKKDDLQQAIDKAVEELAPISENVIVNFTEAIKELRK